MAKAVRLDKFLADAGKGTRSEVKKFIQKGQVQVNGAPAKKPELKVDPEKDTVILSGETVGVAPEFVYYLLNKPAGCVSATEDRNDRTVMEYVPSDRKGLFPVGRLDKDTTGLMIITDDGEFAHNILAPNKHIEKGYEVTIDIPISKKMISDFKTGLVLKDEQCKPAILTVKNKYLAEVRLTEGKYHQIKRMFGVFNAKVMDLNRISMGNLVLPSDLKIGDVREATQSELEKIQCKI